MAAPRNDEELAKEFLTVALIAGNSDQDAKEFTLGYLDTRRLSGVFSLGKIRYERISDASDALTLLHQVISDNHDDILYANVLSASFDIVKNWPRIDRDFLRKIVGHVCGHPGPAVLDACAQTLFRHQNELGHDLLSLLLDTLQDLPATQKGSMRTLDIALSQLLSGHHASEAIAFLSKYLPMHDEHLALSDFDNFQSTLKSKSTQLQDTLISWLLAGEGVLCEGVAALFRNGEDEPFSFDFSVSNLNAAQQIFICRKIIGYLFTQPSIVCSFFVCILRQCDDSVAEKVTNLLFDPMLRSYGGKSKNYLSGILSDDTAFARVQPALVKAGNYVGEIKSIGTIKELHPSESARQTVSLRDFDEMQDARKEAEKHSIFLNLVSRSVVLHGRKILSYARAEGENGEPMEMELHSHSFGFEMPRQEVLDPIGIDYVLRVFRAERLKS